MSLVIKVLDKNKNIMAENNATVYNVFIIDDHPVVRVGIAAIVGRERDMQVCCEAASEKEAVEKLTDCSVDLAIVDLSLSTESGFTLFRRLLQINPNIKLLVLSMHDENVYAEKVIQAGAHGYVMKQEATSTLVTAIRAVMKGDLYVSDRMRSMMLKGLVQGRVAERSAPSPAQLSQTELVVLHHIGMGDGSREIANKLNRSAKTIDAHRANIKRKLGLPSSSALQSFAIQWVRQGV
jgi:DNA-binding NarL/FixJ family response regulator